MNSLNADAFIAVCKLWDINSDSIELIRDVMNPVYSGRTKKGQAVIIRLVESARRDVSVVQAEIDWLDYLYGFDLSICELIASQEGLMLHTLCVGNKECHVSCFKKQEGSGEIMTDSAQWNKALFQKVGAFTGKLHRITAGFTPTPNVRRHSFFQEEVFLSEEDLNLPNDPRVTDAIVNNLNALKAKVCDMPLQLIHGDIKQDNFFYKPDGQLFFYDFDQSCYCWNVYDLVVSLYFNYSYPLCLIPGSGQKDAQYYAQHWLDGYSREYNMPDAQIALIPELCTLRESLIYLIVKKIEPKLDLKNNKSMSAGFDKAYKVIENRLKNNEPYNLL
jgi:amicoumacin kinase